MANRVSRRIIVTGGTGLVGKALCRALLERGDRIHLFARNPDKAKYLFPEAERVSIWAPGLAGEWQHAFSEADAVVHLAGESVGAQRWTENYKQRIHDSRIRGTRELVDAMRRSDPRPACFIAASAVGYYGDTKDRLTDENAPAGQGFLAKLCESWERLAAKASDYGIRTAIPRLGVVLDRNEGALPRMAKPFLWHVGGPLGTGRQYLPWIHLEDLIRILLLALDSEAVQGVFNAVAPEAVTNRVFSTTLAESLGRSSLLPVPGFILRLALGEFADTLVQGQRLEPAILSRWGFTFHYPTLTQALQSMYGAPQNG